MFYKFCYGFIGFGFLFISIRIFANKKFERFAIEHDFPVWVILMLFQPLLAWQLVLLFYLTLRSTKKSKNALVMQIFIL